MAKNSAFKAVPMKVSTSSQYDHAVFFYGYKLDYVINLILRSRLPFSSQIF